MKRFAESQFSGILLPIFSLMSVLGMISNFSQYLRDMIAPSLVGSGDRNGIPVASSLLHRNSKYGEDDLLLLLSFAQKQHNNNFSFLIQKLR